MGKRFVRRERDILEQQNPLGLIKGDLRERVFGGLKYSLSIIAPNKKAATIRANELRRHGVLVRIVKTSLGYGLFTR